MSFLQKPNSRMFAQVKKFIPFILWTFLIFGLCTIPGKSIPKIGWLELLSFDKYVHLSIFFMEQLLFIRALRSLSTDHFLNKNAYVSAALISITYGGILEILQATLLSERSGDIFDFIANSSGVLLACWLFKPLSKKINWLD